MVVEDWRIQHVLLGFQNIANEHGLKYVRDVKNAKKIVDELKLVLDESDIWDNKEKFLELATSFCKWGLLIKGYSFRSLPNRVLDFIYEVGDSIDESTLLLKQQFLSDYKKYCQNRWKINPSTNSSLIEKAALVTCEIAKEFNISMYQCIEFQHECWSKIDSPLSIRTLANKDKARRRVEVAIDIKRKEGILWKNNEQIESDTNKNTNTNISKKWKDIIKIGIDSWVKAIHNTSDIETIFLKSIGKIYLKTKNKEGEEKAKKIFTPEFINKLWEDLNAKLSCRRDGVA